MESRIIDYYRRDLDRNMEKILVTGGAGYIGSILVPQLLRAGYLVTVLDNFLYQQTSLLDVCFNRRLNIVSGDVLDKELLKKLVGQNDIVIPLAAIVGAPACKKNPLIAKEVNYKSIKYLVTILSNQQKVIFPVTNSGYGVGENNIFCTEESPLRPISQYAKDKVEAEKILLDWGNVTSFRLATVFGTSPRMRMDLLVNDFVYKALTERYIVLFESHFRRNYIHIRDVVSAFQFAIDNFDRMRGEIYNHGIDDANLSKFDLCQLIARFIPGLQIFESNSGTDPDQRNYIVSNRKLYNTGFRNQYSLEDGIMELIKGYQFIHPRGFNNV